MMIFENVDSRFAYFFFRSLSHRTHPLLSVQTSTSNQHAVLPISKTISLMYTLDHSYARRNRLACNVFFSYGVTKRPLLFPNVLSSGHRVWELSSGTGPSAHNRGVLQPPTITRSSRDPTPSQGCCWAGFT